MKKIILINLLIAGISACSSDHIPTPDKVTQNIQSVPPGTVISVIALETHKVPKGAQVIEETGLYKTIDNTYDRDGNEVLIPKNAVVRCIYTNDGVTCKITWRSVYVNEDEYSEQKGSLMLKEVTQPFLCDPVRGIKSGNRIKVKFTNTDTYF